MPTLILFLSARAQLIMSSTNPRDVAYLFRGNLRAIHAKAVANDPSFVKIAVLAGRVRILSSTRSMR